MDSPDRADEKTAFRKPSSDKTNRKYRRRSSTSVSPPPAGIPERRSDDRISVSRNESSKIVDDVRNRMDGNKKLDHTSGRGGRSDDSDRYDRHSYRSSRDYRRHDEYRDTREREHSKSSYKSTSDSRDGRYYDHQKTENDYKRSRDGDKYSRPRETYDAASASHKRNHTDRANHSDSTFTMEANRSRDNAARSRGDVFESTGHQNSTREDKKRFGSRETKLSADYDTKGSRGDNEDRPRAHPSPSKKTKLTSFEKTNDLKNSEESHGTAFVQPNSANDADNNNNLDAAKVAAIRAAELVNKNLVGVGVVGALSTDQKKKLLWGSKKKVVEESGHCWDASLFPDREQQEKFNRLMGVKGETKAEQKSAGNQEGKGILDAEKQKELQLDLEKQYTAGLRRRDGRTVGLGL